MELASRDGVIELEGVRTQEVSAGMRCIFEAWAYIQDAHGFDSRAVYKCRMRTNAVRLRQALAEGDALVAREGTSERFIRLIQLLQDLKKVSCERLSSMRYQGRKRTYTQSPYTISGVQS